jgi:hypothetical protein
MIGNTTLAGSLASSAKVDAASVGGCDNRNAWIATGRFQERRLLAAQLQLWLPHPSEPLFLGFQFRPTPLFNVDSSAP